MAIKAFMGGNQSSPGRIISLVAKFSSVCKCGSLIEIGDTMSYDTLSRKSLCYVCVRQEMDFGGADTQVSPGADVLTEVIEHNSSSSLIDRFRELRLAPRPVSDAIQTEMKEILYRFKTEFGASENVKAFVAEIARCRHSGADYTPIKARFAGACIHCKEPSTRGELVFYDHHARRIHCLFCDCSRTL